MNPARTILSVFVGYLALILLGILGNEVLANVLHTRVGGTSAVIGGELVALISGVAAGAITARVASTRALAHATALGLTIVSATSLATAIAKPPTHQIYPSWYPYALAVFGGLGAFVGGVLVAAQSREPKGE